MAWSSASGTRLKRLFLEGFSVLDIAEPLVSFDAEQPAGYVQGFLAERVFDLVGVRVDGQVVGYGRREELAGGLLGDHCHDFGPDDLVDESASLQAAILSLGLNGRCFVTVLDRVGAIITLSDLEKPPVRMFLFGMITILEVRLVAMIRAAFPDGSWTELVSPARLVKARELSQERRRRTLPADLLDCLQFSDKGQLLLRIPGMLAQFQPAIPSKNAAQQAFKELETLRNNLAHAQAIIPASWERIVRFTGNLEQLLGGW